MTMPLKLLPYKDIIAEQYSSGKTCEKIAKDGGWYPQSVANLLKSLELYNSYRPNQGNTRYFKTIDSHQKAYFLGFIAADGCLQNNGNGSNGLTITIHEKDSQILHTLKEEIGCENQIYKITGKMTHDSSKMKKHCRFQLFNKDLYSDLLSYGLTPNKSTTMPNIIVNIPKRYRKSFILGYFDGDGTVCLNIKRNQLTVSFRGTKEFLEGIANELSLEAKWLVKDKHRNCYSLVFWRKSDLINFMKIYKNLNFFLLRKSSKFLEFFEIDKDETISSS